MSQISSSIGLVSGLPIQDLVDSLIALQRRPITQLEQRVSSLVTRRTALLQVSAQLLSVRNAAGRFSTQDFFRPTTTSSSNESILLATADAGAAVGQYAFTVRNLATAYQAISTGFASENNTLVGAGTFTIESAVARLNGSTPLSALRGGEGVQFGRIRITDRGGSSAVVDLTEAATIDDVIRAVNQQDQLEVELRAEGDRLVLADTSGLSSGAITVAEVNGGRTAADLGLAGSTTDAALFGEPLTYLNDDTRLDTLNDGNGIRRRTAQPDFSISLADGTLLTIDISERLAENTPLSVLNGGAGVPGGTIRIQNRAGAEAEIDLSGAQTIGDVKAAIEAAGLDINVALTGRSLTLSDTSTGEGETIVEDLDGSTAAALGIAGTSSTGALAGDDVYQIQTVGDVTRLINAQIDNDDGAGGRKLTASLSEDGTRLVLEDHTTGSNLFAVRSLNGSGTADDLGIETVGSGGAITSRRLVAGLNTVLLRTLNGGAGLAASLTSGTALSELNGGAGIPGGLGTIRITQRNGTQTDVNLSAAATIGDVQAAIESAAPGIEVELDGRRIVIRDPSTSPEGETPGELSIEDLADGQTAAALGIAGTASGETLTGANILHGAGSLTLQDRAGATSTISLAGVGTLAELIEAINAAPVQIEATVNASGLGLSLRDQSGGTGNLVVGGAAGAALGIEHNGATNEVTNRNLQRQYVSSATRLSALNSGVGVPPGRFRITDSNGSSAIVDLTQGNEETLQDVISEINSRGIGVVARINDSGDGLFLEDTAGGTGQLTVSEEGGTTAAALGIRRTADEGETTIDGSFETRIELTGGETLRDVRSAIQASTSRVNVAIINDGTGNRPYRLSITSSQTGRRGALAIDAGTTQLGFSELSRARDATVIFGPADAGAPLVFRSSTNTLEGAVEGLRLDLIGSSDNPVSITVAEDTDTVVNGVKSFVDSINAALSQIDDFTRFDAETNARGVLFGDSTTRRVRDRLLNLTTLSTGEAVSLNQLIDVGIRIGSGGRIELNETRLREALASNPAGVESLFAEDETGLAARIETALDQLIEDDTGLIPLQEEALRNSEEILNTRIDQLEVLLDRRRQRLLAEFNATERIIAQLQGQQSALSALGTQNALLTAP